MLKADHQRPPGEFGDDLEWEVRNKLVNTLYASTRSLAAGAVAGSAITLAIAAKAGLWPLTIAAIAVSLLGVARLALCLGCEPIKAVERCGGK
jgi:hypothetical protein